jgi:hypothetical protein
MWGTYSSYPHPYQCFNYDHHLPADEQSANNFTNEPVEQLSLSSPSGTLS